MASYRKIGNTYYLRWRENGKAYSKRASTDLATTKLLRSQLELRLDREKWGIATVKPCTWPVFRAEYEAYVKANKAPASRKRLTYTLDPFARITGITKVGQITAELLERYKMARIEEIKKASVNRDVNDLKAMCRKAQEWGYLSDNPASKVKWFREAKNRKIEYMEGPQIVKLVKSAYGDGLTAIMIALYTGMRRSEIAYLSPGDVNFKENTISVTPKPPAFEIKNFEIRTLPLHPILRAYLQKLKPNEEWLLVNNDLACLDKAVSRCYEKAGIKGGLHLLRHTFASHLVLSGADIYSVMRLLGHASIKTTEIYLSLRPSHLKAALDRLPY